MKLTKIQREIVKAIRRLHRQGEPLNIPAVKHHHPELMAALYAVKPCWGWKRALRAAGLQYKKVASLRKYPTKAALIAEIQRRQKAGLPLHATGVTRGPHADVVLYDRARQYFGKWAQAVLSAGFPYTVKSHPRKYPTKEAVIAEIQRRQHAGISIRPIDIDKGPNRDRALCWSARHYLGNWAQAVLSAGFPYTPKNYTRKYPTKEAVIAEIQRRQQAGLSIRSTDVNEGPDRDPALVDSARQYFGKWTQAVQAAGIPYTFPAWGVRPRKYPTKEAVIAEIQRRQHAGLPIRATNVVLGPDRNPALADSARQYFGKWTQAVQAAGIPYPAKSRPRKYPTKEAVIAEIQRRQHAGLPIRPYLLQRGPNPDTMLYQYASLYFGRWVTAVESAGIPYPAKSRPRKYPTKETVIAEIQRRQHAGLPIRYTNVDKGPDRDRALAYSARHYFENWAQAVLSAGFPYTFPTWGLRPRKYPSKEAVIAEIQRRQQAGLSIRATDVAYGPDRDRALFWSARHYFENWAQAVLSASFPYTFPTWGLRPRKYPSKEAVIAEIQRRQQAGLPIRYTNVDKGPDRDRALLWSAKRYFENWAQAVLSAGFPYPAQIYPRKYPTKETVNAEIQRRQQAGLSIRATDVAYGPDRDPALYSSARQYFENWTQAVLSASFPYPSR